MDWNRDGGLIILFILLFVVAVVLDRLNAQLAERRLARGAD